MKVLILALAVSFPAVAQLNSFALSSIYTLGTSLYSAEKTDKSSSGGSEKALALRDDAAKFLANPELGPAPALAKLFNELREQGYGLHNMNDSELAASFFDEQKQDNLSLSLLAGFSAIIALQATSEEQGEGGTSESSAPDPQKIAVLRDESANFLANPERGPSLLLSQVLQEVRNRPEAGPLKSMNDIELATAIFNGIKILESK